MAIYNHDICEILNGISTAFIDLPIQDLNNSTMFPIIPVPLVLEPETDSNIEAVQEIGLKVEKRGRGRPRTSALKATVEDIRDPSLRQRIFHNASSARNRRNQKREHDKMKQALVDEADKNTRLTSKVERLEERVETLKTKFLDMIKKKPRVVKEYTAQVGSEWMVQATLEFDDGIFHVGTNQYEMLKSPLEKQ